MTEPVLSVLIPVLSVLVPLTIVTVVQLVPTELYPETNVSVTKDISMMVLMLSVNHVTVNVPIVLDLLITVPVVIVLCNLTVKTFVNVSMITGSEMVVPVALVYLNV